MAEQEEIARQFRVTGRVQGVGFRYFVQRRATTLHLAGHVRNASDGSVEVYATGPIDAVNELEAALRQGPPHAQVRSVEAEPAGVIRMHGFDIR